MWFCWPVYFMYKIIRCLPPQTTRVVSARATYYRDVIWPSIYWPIISSYIIGVLSTLSFSLWWFLRALIWFAWKYVKILIQQLILVGCAYKYQNLNSSMHLNLLFLASMQIWKSVFFISRTSSRPRLQRKSSMFGGKKLCFCRVAESLVHKTPVEYIFPVLPRTSPTCAFILFFLPA